LFRQNRKKESRKKYGLLEKPGSWFHQSISRTFKDSLQAFALERSLCESCECLAKGIDKIRVILDVRPLKKTPPF